ncbi:hypothetical protein ANN_10382, partial [Periplaneta americana]
FPDRWIGTRGGPNAWPPRSPDLNPLDFYLWGHLKSLVYSSPVPDLESLRNRIVACSEDIRNTPGVWDRVRRSMRHRCEKVSEKGTDGKSSVQRQSGFSLAERWLKTVEYRCFMTWPPRSPDMTACDFFLWGLLKDRVFVPPLPRDLEELKTRIREAAAMVTEDMLKRVWEEFDFFLF